MKIRFLFVGDNHLDSRTPTSRLDNYMESGLAELEETLKIAKATKCDYYVLAGDLFNRIDVGGECRNRAIKILASDNGEPWPFKKHLTIGNHDIAHDPDKMEKSAAQSLVSAGILECVDSVEGIMRFFHFRPSLDQELRDGLLTKYDEKIMFLHASITDKPLMFDHVLFKDLEVNPKTKLLLSGHIHRRMEADKPGVKFLNPGSLGRPEISSDYEKNKVSVLLVEYDLSTDEYKTKTIELRSSLPYDVVFDVDANKKKKIENKNTELFIDAITNVSMDNSITSNITEDLLAFAKKANIAENVSDMAIKTVKIIKSGGEL
jgi:DNA repair exonuclease SbcCD nuclease subunit